MEAEHGEIDPILEACAAGFARLAERPDADARAALVVRLVAGRESLARHLAHEETDAIALIQQVMTDADWTRLEAEHFTPKLTLSLLLTVRSRGSSSSCHRRDGRRRSPAPPLRSGSSGG